MADPPHRKITIPGSKLRALANTLLSAHPLSNATSWAPFYTSHSPSQPEIRIVCISDTHTTQPDLPPGDLLIHAGDLTQDGTFSEVQRQLLWLDSLPFEHKILIAGNHDVLFDETFLEKHPARRHGEVLSVQDLDFGTVTYLQHETVTLTFANGQRLKLFGSPYTPQCGVFAFQYAPIFEPWDGAIPIDTDVVVTHGPPRLHRDKTSVYRAGCPFLGVEIARVRPKLVVFGHIHVGYGIEDCVLDGTRRRYELVWNNVVTGFKGYMTLGWMAMCVLWAKMRACLPGGLARMRRGAKVTRFVNAAVVSGPENNLTNDAIVVVL